MSVVHLKKLEDRGVGTSYRYKTGSMWMLGSKSKDSSSAEVDFLDLCNRSVRSTEDIVNRGNLLNQRQCQDLSSKLSRTTLNIRELVLHCRSPAVLFRPALENLCRYLEKAKLLVGECGEEEWWVAVVVQSQNENAFREILLDVSLCYTAIYEQAKSVKKDSNVVSEDLQETSVFRPAKVSVIYKDQQDLRKRLEVLANEPSSVSLWDQIRPWRGPSKQYLARYLLVKLNCTSVQALAKTLDTCSAILWAKETEPSNSWGNYRLLGAGAGSSGVCSTKWMGIPCAKKVIHEQAFEGFFLKEAGILACVKHPCIVNFYCCGNGQEPGDPFIAMELLEKRLSKLIEDQKNEYFSLPVVLEIMVQMANGMRFLHDQGVAHRDLKPQNVVVNRLTSPHLSDHFGVKLVDSGMSKTEVEMCKSNTMTVVGIGTTMYRAPEIHPHANTDGKRKVDGFKADVFSFSMTCAHLLSLKRPFRDLEQLRDLYTELMNGRRPELPSIYPEELVALLRQYWDLNLKSRPSFVKICIRLELFQHNTIRGYLIVDEYLQEAQRGCSTESYFIKAVFYLQSTIQRPCVAKVGDGDVYHCDTCYFDAHPDCAEIKDKVNVFFHAHPLHLLPQNHYNNKPDTICGFCEELVEVSEWVYKCEQCDFDVHAFCTKYPRSKMVYAYDHHFTLIQSLPGKTLSCKFCKGDIEGLYYYECSSKCCAPLCGIPHPLPLYIFDNTHKRLKPVVSPKVFYCGRCGELGGFPWYYSCFDCHLDIHVDCVDDMEEEEDKWIEAYDKFMLEYWAKMIIQRCI